MKMAGMECVGDGFDGWRSCRWMSALQLLLSVRWPRLVKGRSLLCEVKFLLNGICCLLRTGFLLSRELGMRSFLLLQLRLHSLSTKPLPSFFSSIHSQFPSESDFSLR